jgi:hypothetical protein
MGCVGWVVLSPYVALLWRRGLELAVLVAGLELVLAVSGRACIARCVLVLGGGNCCLPGFIRSDAFCSVGVPKTALVTKMETAPASCWGIAALGSGAGLGV